MDIIALMIIAGFITWIILGTKKEKPTTNHPTRWGDVKEFASDIATLVKHSYQDRKDIERHRILLDALSHDHRQALFLAVFVLNYHHVHYPHEAAPTKQLVEDMLAQILPFWNQQERAIGAQLFHEFIIGNHEAKGVALHDPSMKPHMDELYQQLMEAIYPATH